MQAQRLVFDAYRACRCGTGAALIAVLVSGHATAGEAIQPMTADECVAWTRERSFAQAVERHDAGAFAAHLHEGAVFIGGGGRVARGRAAVTTAWAAIIAGTNGVLYWHPRQVLIGGDPDVALSRGPYWLRNPDPQASQPWLLGQFISTWVRAADGQWYVLFDGGGGNEPRPASDEEITALRAALPAECPLAPARVRE